jgi:hypothetical protein
MISEMKHDDDDGNSIKVLFIYVQIGNMKGQLKSQNV